MIGAPPRQALCLSLALLVVLLSATETLADCRDSNTCTTCNQLGEVCHQLASCEQEPSAFGNGTVYCACLPDIYGDGLSCTSEAAMVSLSFKIGTEWDSDLVFNGNWHRLVPAAYTQVLADFESVFVTGYTIDPKWTFSYRITGEGSAKWMSLILIVGDMTMADAVISEWTADSGSPAEKMLQRTLTAADSVTIHGITLSQDADFTFSPDSIDTEDCVAGITLPVGYMPVEPRPYTYTAGTTEDPVFVLPVGLDVTSVYFKHDCLSAGCWVVEVDYTIGEDNFNVFYVPRSDNSDTLSYDFDYAANAPDFDATYLPANHPCNLDNYVGDPTEGIETTVSVCCVPEFVNNYRVVRSFAWDQAPDGCESADFRADPSSLNYSSIYSECFGAGKVNVGGSGVQNHPDAPIISTENMPPSALTGLFSNWNTAEDMQYSNIQQNGVIDPFLGIYKATFYLDEIELRRYMGKLSGTVSVEHSVEFFVGLIDFKPNGLQAGMLNPQAKQIDIMVEKTDYFTVATHGQNDYTFLRYTNLRLIETYLQDTDNTDDLNTDVDNSLGPNRTDPTGVLRNNRDYKAQFVQVTFTLGEQYGQKPGYDVIPLDSVRVGRGEFLVENSLKHMCLDYNDMDPSHDSQFPASGAGPLGGASVKADFDTMIAQSCAPQTDMCRNPQSTDTVDALEDSFVAFNIPVGFDFPGSDSKDFFGNPANDLSNNIFVSMVIQVENREAMAGLSDLSNITKTTLTASIPYVDGGVNVFCDSVTAKTDLREVANAKIYMGSAGIPSELSRLRIEEGGQITTSVLDERDAQYPVAINADSIESAMMTLVVWGNDTFFREDNGMGLELEDMYTLHIVEDDAFFMENGCSSPWDCRLGTFESLGAHVFRLLNEPGGELYNATNDLQVDGYALNGAFELRIDRGGGGSRGRARLETTPGLDRAKGGALSPCQFGNPGAPEIVYGDFRQTCVIRHDVDTDHPLQAPFPFDWVTELPDCASDTNCDDKRTGTPTRQGLEPEAFIQRILGSSDYAADLGTNYSKLIRETEKLNGIWRRAWWINPGYEWTSEQLGGQPIFSVSQKIVMVALIGLNENRAAGGRRRFLSVSTDRRADTGFEDTNTGADTRYISNDGVTPESILARMTNTETANVKKFSIEMYVPKEDECKSVDEIRSVVGPLLKGYFTQYATDVADMFVLSADVSRDASAQCGRRAMGRKALSAYSQSKATIRVMVAFQSADPLFNRDGMESQPGIEKIDQDGGERIAIGDVGGTPDDGVPGVKNPGATTGGEDGEEGGSSNIGLIAGIAGGVVGVGLIAAAAFMVIKKKRAETQPADLVPTAAQQDIENLKFQLQSDA